MSRILIVDDEAPIRRMLRKWFESAGYEVMEAANGEEAVRCYRKNPADLIVTDIVMPEKEGVETILALKDDYPDIRIIAMSGGGKFKTPGYLELARLFGAARTFEKPISKEDLLAAIKELMP